MLIVVALTHAHRGTTPLRAPPSQTHMLFNININIVCRIDAVGRVDVVVVVAVIVCIIRLLTGGSGGGNASTLRASRRAISPLAGATTTHAAHDAGAPATFPTFATQNDENAHARISNHLVGINRRNVQRTRAAALWAIIRSGTANGRRHAQTHWRRPRSFRTHVRRRTHIHKPYTPVSASRIRQ